MLFIPEPRIFPKNCRIEKIHFGREESRKYTLYATLVDEEGSTLISATLEYITEQLSYGVFK